jgi:hypothetical protein
VVFWSVSDSVVFWSASDSVVFWSVSDSVVFWSVSDSVVFWSVSDSVVFWSVSDSVVFLFFVLLPLEIIKKSVSYCKSRKLQYRQMFSKIMNIPIIRNAWCWWKDPGMYCNAARWSLNSGASRLTREP